MLYQQFRINLDHLLDTDAFYKKVKEEYVTGFNGDPNELNPVFITLYLITNFLTYQVLVGFLVAHSPWFKWTRTDIYKNRWKILFCSIFDIICSVLPIIMVISEYKHAYLFHLSAFSLIFFLLLVHVLTGKQKTHPIFSTWLFPGGANKHRRFYEIDIRKVKTKKLTKVKTDKADADDAYEEKVY